MSTSVDSSGTPFPPPASPTGDEGKDRARDVDLYDLAVAGAHFVLDGTEDAAPANGTRAHRELRSAVRSLSGQRSLRKLVPAWARAGDALMRRSSQGDPQGTITATEIDEILADRRSGESFGQLLLRRTELAEGLIAEALSRATTAPTIALTVDPVQGEPFRSPEEAVAAPKHPVLVDQNAARRIPRELASRHDMVLVAAWEHEGVIAMVDPGDEAALWEAQEVTGLRLTRFTALASQLRLAIERCWQPRPDVAVPPTGTARQALPFATAVGVPLAVLIVGFLFVFRENLDLRHHFALASLVCGLFFFSYALRYYVTTAAVVGAVLFGDRLRRQRLVSQIRAMKAASEGRVAPANDPRKLSLEALAATVASEGPPGRIDGAPAKSKHDYRTLRGERLDDVGAIVTAASEKIGQHRLPRDRQPFVSIQLAMYNERQVVDRLLRACTSFDYDNYEVIVADDSTDPDALALLDRWSEHPRVRILHRPTRKGFKGGALQEAMRRMDERTEYVMIFDADFIPPPDAIWHFLDYFGRLPGPQGENGHGYHTGDLRGVADGVPVNGDRLAAVQGYQWHMLNASENWITKGIRTEFSGSYVLERAAQELFGTMKMISGSVYMIRADVLRRLGWSTSITEDWELTIRLYLAGYKVLYTPYIQAPSECVSRIRQLVRQRMRWARGHTFNVKKYFFAVLKSPNMTWREKAEFLYYAPYYLQSILFLAGTVAWVLGIFLLGQRLPQWGEALGWSLVVSNVLALPLMNLAGLVLEGSVKRDIVGLGSFVGLSTLLVPFQGWAALRGLLEPTEGGWDRTPKSGRITEAIGALRLGKLLQWELPKRRKVSSRAAHILVTCIAGFLAGAIVAVGALSMRAAASTGKVGEGDLVVPFVFGTLVPLAIVAYGWLKLHRRIAVCVLAAAIGLSSNVVFLANTIPASATAGTSSTFMFKRSGAFHPPRYDMEQGYVPSGTATQCGAGYVAPSYRSSTTAGSDFLTSVAPAKPAGTATDDILVAGLYLEEPAGTVTAPSGWTLLTSVTQTGSAPDYILRVYWKRATSSEPASYTWSWPTSQWAAIFVAAYSGAATSGDPFDTYTAKQNLAQTDQPTTPTTTTTVANTTLLAIFGNWTSTTYLAGSGMTERVDYNALYLQDATQAPAGTTGTKDATASVADWASGVLAALKGAPTVSGNSFTCTWASDTFTSTMSLGAGTATVDLYGENPQPSIAFRSASSAYHPGIAFVNAGAQVASQAGAGSTFTAPLPTNWAAGDFAVLVVAGRPPGTTEVAEPTGWTLRSSFLREVGANDLRIQTFYRFLQSGDSDPVITVPTGWNGTSAGLSAQVAAWKRVDTTTPFDVADQANGAAAAQNWTPPSITTTTPNAWVVTVVASADNNELFLTTPNSFTTRMEGQPYDTTTGGDHAVGMADYWHWAGGAATMPVWRQFANNNDAWAGITFALRPDQTLTIAKPSGTAQNDVMVASIGFRPNNATVTAPTGWTPVRTTTQPSGTAHGLATYYKVAGASEPASYSWTVSGVHTMAGGIQSFSGADTTTPIDVEAGQATASSTTHATPSITTTVANTMLVTAHNTSLQGATWTPDGTLTEAYDSPGGWGAAPDAGHMSIEGSYGPQAAAGLVGSKTATLSGTSTGTTHILALKPASASCTVTTTLKHVRPSTTIAFRASSQAAVGSGVLTLTLAVPTGTVDGDVMIAVVAVRPDTATVATPTGWSIVRTVPNTTATASKLIVYRKVASGEPASYAWSLGASPTGTGGGIMSFSGVDTASPVDIDNGQSTASSYTHDTPSVTTTVIDTMTVATFETATSAPWSEASGMAEAIDVASEVYPNNAGISIASFYKLQASTGATGTKTGTAEYQLDTGATHILALKPATVGSTTTLGSGSGSFSSATTTLTQIGPFGTSAATFADGDRLHLEASVPSGASCNARIHFDGATEQSKLLVATIVPEGILGLLLLAPVLPIAIRRRWIRVPGWGPRDRGVPPGGPRA